MAPTPSSLDKRLTAIEEHLVAIRQNGSGDSWVWRVLRYNGTTLFAVLGWIVWGFVESNTIKHRVYETIPTSIATLDREQTKAVDDLTGRVNRIAAKCCPHGIDTGYSPIYCQELFAEGG